jgi:hypothetical protein
MTGGIQEFDFSVDVMQAILWRHNQADNLASLLTQKQAWYDLNQEQFWNDWFTNVFDLRTANDFGCAVWAKVLGVPLGVIVQPDYTTKKIFGFAAFGQNFDRSNFANKTQAVIPLTIEQKRLILRLRFAQLIAKGASVTWVNRIIQYIFSDLGYGAVYVLDGLNMTCSYVFTFAIPSQLTFVLQNYDILPRPDGVLLTTISTVRKVFGFGPYQTNFFNGNFGA